VDVLRAGNGPVDDLEERQDVGGGVPGAARGDDLSCGDVQRREQVGGVVASAVMVHRPCAATDHGQAGLGTVQGLASGLLAKGEDHAPIGSFEILNVSTFHGFNS
jgi:hypothetical protein